MPLSGPGPENRAKSAKMADANHHMERGDKEKPQQHGIFGPVAEWRPDSSRRRGGEGQAQRQMDGQQDEKNDGADPVRPPQPVFAGQIDEPVVRHAVLRYIDGIVTDLEERSLENWRSGQNEYGNATRNGGVSEGASSRTGQRKEA